MRRLALFLLIAASWLHKECVLAATASSASCSAPQNSHHRPEKPASAQHSIRIGDHTLPVQYTDNVPLSADELDELADGMIRHSKTAKPHRFQTTGLNPDDFKLAYTFEVAATREGLAHLSDALGLPALDRFLEAAVDSSCTAFLMNAVVLGPGLGLETPWGDFALRLHNDQSLAEYGAVAGVELPLDGGARTVAILYLSNVSSGGELEVFDDGPEHSTDLTAAAEDHAAQTCTSSSTESDCPSRALDDVLRNSTLGRVRPVKGRLLHFDGYYAHAVRRVTHAEGTASQTRVSLVLEQFQYPAAVVRTIPTLQSQCRGQPLYETDELKARFHGKHAKKGSRIAGKQFERCVNGARAPSGIKIPLKQCLLSHLDI